MDVVGLGFATVDVLARVPRLPLADEAFRVLDVSIQGGGPVATALVTVRGSAVVPATSAPSAAMTGAVSSSLTLSAIGWTSP